MTGEERAAGRRVSGVTGASSGDLLGGRFRDAHGLLDHGRAALRADALAIAAAGLAAVDPAAALRRLVRIAGDALIVRGRPWLGLRPPSPLPDEPDETVVGLDGRRVFVVGAGKASIGMAAVLDELLGARLADAAVVVKHGQAAMLPRPLRHIEVLEASHPVPDESSLAGGLRLLGIARQARPGDLVVGIVTGGSSALAVAPAEGISLADKTATNRLLLACGADIVAINNVRKHLSAIKGGLLAQACGAAAGRPASCQVVNFTVSDVVGDPLDYVTDLTVPDRSTWALAQETCDRYGLWERLPPAVARRLRRADPAAETPKELPAVSTWVVADAARMCAAAATEARRLGYSPRLLGLDWEGEARAAGERLARELRASPPGACLLAGGENTVTLPPSAIAGRRRSRAGGPPDDGREIEAPGGTGGPHGGPSQEAAAAAALRLATELRATAGSAAAPSSAGSAATTPVASVRAAAAVILCLDSDGTDGPTDAAGGLVDDLTAVAYPSVAAAAVTAARDAAPTIAAPAAPAGIPPAPPAGAARAAPAGAALADALAAHTAYAALAACGDLVVTGPTGTNVNDLRVALNEHEGAGGASD